MTILEQIEERNSILSEYIDRVAKGEVLSQEDKEKRDATFAELQELRKMQAMELDLEKGKVEDEKRALEAEREYRAAKISTPESNDKKVDELRDAFEAYLRYGDTMQLRTVTDYQNKGVSADGGYLAPADFYAAIVEKRNNLSIVRPLATVLNIANDTNIPVEGSDATASWVAEGGSISGTKQAFASVALTLRKLVCKVGVTEEMLSDSKIDLIPYLANKMARLFVEAEETAFIKGAAASNQPVGLLSSGITTIRTANASAIAAGDVLDVYEALNPNYRKNAVWIISTAMEKALANLTTGTGGYPLWQQSWVPGVPSTLLGKPVYVSNDLDNTLAVNKYQAIFGDLKYYYIGDKEGISVTRYDKRDVDGRFDFLGSMRTSGALVNTDAVQILQCKAS